MGEVWTVKREMKVFMCSKSFTRYQVVACLLVILFAGVHFSLFIPHIGLSQYLPLLVLYSVLLVLILLSALFISLVNPADPALAAPPSPPPKCINFQRYCAVCCRMVALRSRHCSRCKKCIERFDHHCQWLNACICRRNYCFFALLITALESFSLLQVYIGAATIRLVCSGEAGRALLAVTVTQTYDLRDGGYFFLFLLMLTTVLSIVIAATNGFLFSFHVYIAVRCMTTHEYLSSARNRGGKVTPLADATVVSVNSQGISVGNEAEHCLEERGGKEDSGIKKDVGEEIEGGKDGNGGKVHF